MPAGMPLDLHPERAHTARVYDYFLGGKDNYDADREAGEQVKQWWPGAVTAARVNREFMNRATARLADEGITQFLDIGTGIPTKPNLHEIAQEINPRARVVYVDNDPIVLAHARALLVSSPEGRTTYVAADATAPEVILENAQLRETLDLSQPVALSLVALMHFVSDDKDPHRIIKTLVDALAPGSYLVMSHVTQDFAPEDIAALTRVYHDKGLPLQPRTHDEFAEFFQGLDVVDPGIVPVHRWHCKGVQPPAGLDAEASVYGGVACKALTAARD